MSKLTPTAQTSLLSLIAAGQGYLTQEEGSELMTAGLILVTEPPTPSPDNPSAFHCTVTEAGKAAAASLQAGAPPAPAPVAPTAPPVSSTPVDVDGDGQADFQISSGIAVPAIKRGGGGGNRGPRPEKYPFSKLEIGQSFHVKPGEDVDKTARKMSTQVSNANKAARVPAVPETMETVTKRRAKRDEAGNIVKDANGKKVQETYQVEQPVTVATKVFVSRKVGATDPEGVGVRVFRIDPSQA